jgi:hypothetical protein
MEGRQQARPRYHSDTYDGEWEDDNRHGHGVVTLANGDTYDGEFKDGVYTLATGNNYDGEWIDDKKHGWRQVRRLV